MKNKRPSKTKDSNKTLLSEAKAYQKPTLFFNTHGWGDTFTTLPTRPLHSRHLKQWLSTLGRAQCEGQMERSVLVNLATQQCEPPRSRPGHPSASACPPGFHVTPNFLPSEGRKQTGWQVNLSGGQDSELRRPWGATGWMWRSCCISGGNSPNSFLFIN